MESVELSQRDREILRDVIETFLIRGEPVSSRRVAKDKNHDLSAASIRNSMADLEDLGLLKQPHTSAGRVPTAQGYHFFIDSLMKEETPSAISRRLIDETIGHATGDQDELGTTVSQLLSELSSQIGIVVTPDLGQTVLRRLEFVPLTGSRVLCVTASSNGFVDHKVVELDDRIERDELVRVSNYLTENFAGLTLSQIRERLIELMNDARAQMDELMNRAVVMAEKGLDLELAPQLVVQGTESLLDQPELSDLTRVRRLLETFTDRAKVVTLLNRCIDGEGVRVFIGEESDLTSELDFSLIIKQYAAPGSGSGTVALFGPSRMAYSRLIPLVDYLGARLSAALETTF